MESPILLFISKKMLVHLFIKCFDFSNENWDDLSQILMFLYFIYVITYKIPTVKILVKLILESLFEPWMLGPVTLDVQENRSTEYKGTALRL